MASVEEWMAAVTSCWCGQLGDTVVQCCETAGQPVIADCCAGVGWTRLVSAYPADGEMRPKGVPERCRIDTWAIIVEVGVTRCAPEACGQLGNSCCETEALAAATAREDFARFRRMYGCCLPSTEIPDGFGGTETLRIDEILPGRWTTAVQGQCLVSSGQVTLYVADYCACA